MELFKYFVLGFFMGYFLIKIYFYIKKNIYFKLKHTDEFNNKKKIMYLVVFFNGNTTFSVFNKITHYNIISYSIFNFLIINEEIKK